MSHSQTAGSVLRALVHSVKFVNPTAVTLTMKKRFREVTADDILASDNFAHFRKRLDQQVLGSAAKRYGKTIKIVAVLEKSAEGRLHYHCIIERPSHWSFEQFAEAIRACWSKTDFGYHHIDIQDQADTGWTDYILKARQKQSLLDSIDWRNCSLTAE